MGSQIKPLAKTIGKTMTIPIQIQNSPLVSSLFPTFQINTLQSVVACANVETVATTIHEIQPIVGRKVNFLLSRPSLFPILLRCAIQSLDRIATTLFCTQMLQPQEKRIHVMCPLPVQPTHPFHIPFWASALTPSWHCELPSHGPRPS